MLNNNEFVRKKSSRAETMEYSDDLQSVISESPTTFPAVLVKNATKCYKNGVPVINNLSMRVATGSIYGLLGASGCGKTTVLSCIVGLRTLDSGSISVFGCKPSHENGIHNRSLSRSIGYMPQDLALYDVFTIGNILHYFGRLYDMTSVEVKARMQFLIRFLELPETKQLIKTLSGGQQRRVSLAIAMLHSPKLLILDEPTVGVDPLLRESIWSHLQDICCKHNTTILLTTHYVEEASKHSAMVGIMRNGRLLTENPPETLLKSYQSAFLEKVFLQLCAEDDGGLISDTPQSHVYHGLSKSNKSILADTADKFKIKGISYKPDAEEIIYEKNDAFSPQSQFQNLRFVQCALVNSNQILALMIRTFLFLIRTPWFAILVLLLPAIQMITFLLILGHDPKNIAIGIVNHELTQENLLDSCQTMPKTGCFPTGVSCRFLTNFPTDEFQWIVYHSEEDALQSVQKGITWGYMTIPHNYTQHMLDRSLLKNYATNSTIDGSIIVGRLDASYNLKSDFIQLKAYDYFQTFMKDLATSCDTNPATVEVPLKFNAIYGGLGSTYLQYMQPGFLALILILLPMSCALRFIQDRKAGTFQRSVVAGLEYSNMLIELLISEGSILALQIMICYTIIVISGITIEGSVWQYLLLLFLVGMVGLSIGFLAGQAVDQEVEAVFIILACYLPMMVSSGATWPFESLPTWAKVIYTMLPTTLSIRSLRSIVTRGWGFSQTWPGFAMSICWIIVLWITSTTIRKIRNK